MQPTILNFTPPLVISETINHILNTSVKTYYCSERDILACVLTNMSDKIKIIPSFLAAFVKLFIEALNICIFVMLVLGWD